MQLKLDVPQLYSSDKINYQHKLMLLGSCFTQNIGSYLYDYHFNINLNSFGILFHPLAIFNALNHVIDYKIFTENDIVFHQEIWHSMQHHSDFSDTNLESCLNRINHQIEVAHHFIKNTDFLILTLGTSILYELKANHQIVANCHKLDSKLFTKRFLDISEINHNFEYIYNKLIKINPNLKIIFTVSPVRHWRDGLIENNRSKARLIYCIDEWCKKFDNVEYFPAYELIIDDLRDYRFFAEDLCHPNQQAIDYVWQYFCEMYFDDITLEYINDLKELKKMQQHKVKFENTQANINLQNNIKEKILYINNKYTNYLI